MCKMCWSTTSKMSSGEDRSWGGRPPLLPVRFSSIPPPPSHVYSLTQPLFHPPGQSCEMNKIKIEDALMRVLTTSIAPSSAMVPTWTTVSPLTFFVVDTIDPSSPRSTTEVTWYMALFSVLIFRWFFVYCVLLWPPPLYEARWWFSPLQVQSLRPKQTNRQTQSCSHTCQHPPSGEGNCCN